MNSKYIINICNSTYSKWDVECGYQQVTITDKETGETLSFRCCSSIADIARYVDKYAEALLKTADTIRDRLVRFKFIKDDYIILEG